MNIEKVKQETIKLALTELFKRSTWFSVSDLERILKVAGVNSIDPETRSVLQALHCKDYASMSQELRNWLLDTCLNLLASPTFVLEFSDSKETVEEPARVKKTWFLKV